MVSDMVGFIADGDGAETYQPDEEDFRQQFRSSKPGIW